MLKQAPMPMLVGALLLNYGDSIYSFSKHKNSRCEISLPSDSKFKQCKLH